jgi:hypothetical protein
VRYEGKTAEFTNRQVNLSYVDLTLSYLTSRTYPVAYAIEADNGGFKLFAGIDVLKDVPLLTIRCLCRAM